MGEFLLCNEVSIFSVTSNFETRLNNLAVK
ncbi:hypothetical protein GGR10_000146 [Bartonella chomelii]|uniref:Uncharacterized protein n=1 Tax=Bartonella chomelii TaxID=236402 RepID=A0ABR6E227_9HYPH|nr:hypothetical protein [Bartonella chomelii]